MTHQPETIRTMLPSNLTLSPFNPRRTVTDKEIADLAESIREIGLVQSIAGVETATGVQIVAGGRRMRALQKLEAEGVVIEVPVQIAPNADTAQMWAAAENQVREALPEASMARQGKLMRARGGTAEDLSRVFAIPVKFARQYMALADLPDVAIDALEANTISFEQAKTLTTARSPQLFEQAFEAALEGLGAHSLRTMLAASIPSNDRRVQLVGLDALEEAGATVVRDLFEDRSSVEGEAIVDKLFEERLAQLKAEFLEDGWAWFEVDLNANSFYEACRDYERTQPDPDCLTGQDAEDFERLNTGDEWCMEFEDRKRLQDLREVIQSEGFKTEHRALTGVVLFFGYNGEPNFERGLVRADEAEAALDAELIGKHQHNRLAPKDDQAGSGQSASGAEQSNPMELSNALRADLEQARLLSLIEKVRQKPELVLDILAFQISGQIGQYDKLFDVSVDNNARLPDKLTGLNAPEDLVERDLYTNRPDDYAEAFASYRAQGKAARNRDLSQTLAKSLTITSAGGRRMAEALEYIAGAHIRDLWTPTAESFFARVNSAYLVALYAELLDLSEGDDTLKAFAKMKKGEQADHMHKLFNGTDLDEALKIDDATRLKIRTWSPAL